jgi:phosphoglycerate dehydrogenase-like enzyme
MASSTASDRLKVLIVTGAVMRGAARYAEVVARYLAEEVQSGRIEILLADDPSQIPENVDDIDVLATEALVRRVPEMKSLKWMMTFSSGYDHWEKSGLIPPGVPLVHGPGGSAIPIAEYVMAVMLAHVKHLDEMYENQKQAKFIRIEGQELFGKTLGIIGLGGIGRAVAKRAKAFDMRVIGTEVVSTDIPYVDEVYPPAELETVLRQSDFVVLAVPETPETINMMNEDRFRMMKPTAYFINVARGSLVVKEALIRALDEGWIAGAAIDVFWIKDPLPSFLPPDDPLWRAKNVRISPHVSSWTDMYPERFGQVLAENLRRYLNGEPLINVAPLKLKPAS